jgi:HK97 family phage prohead protease
MKQQHRTQQPEQTIQKMQTIETRGALPDVETRAFGQVVEVRAKDDGKKMLRGYALKWNQRYDMGWFTEEISRAALDNADLTDVRALLNHDPNVVLGRTTSGTLRLAPDSTGLAYEIDLPDTQAARDLAVSIERGDISQSSWGFTLRYDDNTQGDVWARENGKDHRTITAVNRVYDVSPVTFPANPGTEVAKRSLMRRIESETSQKQQEILNQRSAELRALIAQYPNT